MKPTILLVRHGATASNSDPGGGSHKEEKVRGQADIPMTAEGKQDALALAKKCADFKIAKIYYSPLSRTAFTAKAIAKAQTSGTPKLVPSKELLSWDVGNFVGQNYEKVMPKLRRYQSVAPDTALPGGESWNAFLKPWLRFVDARMDEAKKTDGAIALVTHTWPLRALDAWLVAGMKDDYKVDQKTLAKDTPLHTGEAYVIEFDGGKWKDGRSFAKAA